MVKRGFVLYGDQYDCIRSLTVEQRAGILDAVYCFHLEEPLPELDPVASMAFKFIRRQMERDKDKYLERCEKNKKNIRKRWNQSNTTVYDRIRTNTNDTDNDTDTDTDTDRKKEIIKKKSTSVKKRFCPPSPEEVEAYISSTGKEISGERFCDFYGSKNWMVGKNKMKDWKAAARGWASRDKEKKNQPLKASTEYQARQQSMSRISAAIIAEDREDNYARQTGRQRPENGIISGACKAGTCDSGKIE